MGFEVVVLGSSGTFPTPERACTGFLLGNSGFNVWVDAGMGTFANLQRHLDFFDVNAVLISHLHVDHVLDIYSFYYALRYSIWAKGPTGLKVYGPPETEDYLTQMLSTGGGKEHRNFAGYLEFEPVKPGDEITVGPFQFSFGKTLHPIDVLSMRIGSGDRTLVYTSDTGWTDDLVEFARGADVLIAEASLQEPNPVLKEVHMTAEEAGQLAAEAEVGKLVLTHIQPGLDHKRSVELAAKHFSGEILFAEENLKFRV